MEKRTACSVIVLKKITTPYLERNSFRDQVIMETPPPNLGIVIVIPCHNEPALTASLRSLSECMPPKCNTEVIIVINASAKHNASIHEQNQQTLEEAQKWIKDNQSDHLQYHLIYENQLPEKHAGVGLARKIGMDEAVRRFEAIGKDGVIVCYDADSRCDNNYLTAIESHFYLEYPNTTGCSIYYEHPLDEENTTGITQYELHLRYYVNMQRWANFPHAYQTIGSSMAVRSSIYQKQGGMNRRKAGEDFYFLHKIIPLGGFTELNSTRVIPSPRTSDRVPFGTGKAMNDWQKSDNGVLTTYNPKTFNGLKELCSIVPELFTTTDVNQVIESLPESMNVFLKNNQGENAIKNAIQHSASKATFISRFYQWFNGFTVMKYAHFCRDKYYPNISVHEAADRFLKIKGIKVKHELAEQLKAIRKLDRLYRF